MRIIIAGSRDFKDFYLLDKECIKYINELKSLGYNTKRENVGIISGGAKGADKLGEMFARKYKLGLKIFEANWEKHGKAAGMIRNKEMAKFASEDEDLGVLIAFWNESSPGTRGMIEIAKKYGLIVFVKKI